MADELHILSTSPESARALSVLAEAAGYQSDVRGPSLDGLTASELKRTEVLIVDSTIPVAEQLRVIIEVHRRSPTTQVIAIGSLESLPALQQQSALTNCLVLNAPFENEELLNVIARATVLHHLSIGTAPRLTHATRMSSLNILADVVAVAPIMQRLLLRLERMAAVHATVLLSGESGTGKTLFASLIHKLSPRREGPFMTVSCANLPRDLLESELFGYEKGSFTGANQAKPGVIELCHHGTLFLDELGELPVELQPKLLTFLQDHTVRRVGGRELKQVDVRIVTATNRDLAEMVSCGDFREDLFFRVNVLNVRIPSLAERKADISPLAQRIISKISKERGIAFSLSQGALDKLGAYPWPGNVRELEHVLERATAFCESSFIQAADVDLLDVVPGPGKPSYGTALAGRTLRSVEEQLLRETLDFCQGDKVRAAEMLGVSLKTIYNKLRRLRESRR